MHWFSFLLGLIVGLGSAVLVPLAICFRNDYEDYRSHSHTIWSALCGAFRSIKFFELNF